MKRLITAALFFALAGVAAASPSGPTGNLLRPGVTQMCLDVDGGTLPVTCTASGAATDRTEFICSCAAGQKVDAPVCADGTRPPSENLSYIHARRDAAQDGSLIGDTYEGAPMCAPARGAP